MIQYTELLMFVCFRSLGKTINGSHGRIISLGTWLLKYLKVYISKLLLKRK
jgi:hypothetical protein